MVFLLSINQIDCSKLFLKSVHIVVGSQANKAIGKHRNFVEQWVPKKHGLLQFEYHLVNQTEFIKIMRRGEKIYVGEEPSTNRTRETQPIC